MKSSIKLLFVAFALFASSVSADTLNRVLTVDRVFSEGTNTAGFYPEEPLTECQYQLFYIDLSKESGRAIFSMVLSAKATGDKIIRVDYTVSSSGTCTVSGLHIG